MAGRPPRETSGILKGAVINGVATFLWVVLTSLLKNLTSNLYTSRLLRLSVGALLKAFISGILTTLLGNCSYNPVSAAASLFAGKSPLTAIHLAFHLPIQVGAASAALHFLHDISPPGIPKPPTDYPGSVSALFVAFIKAFLQLPMTLSLLLSSSGWPTSSIHRKVLLAFINDIIILPAGSLTGINSNPLVAFAWDYFRDRLSNLSHFIVYWLGPYAGAFTAAMAYRSLAHRRPTPHPQPRRPRQRTGRAVQLGGGEPSKALDCLARPGGVDLPRGGQPLPRAGDLASLPVGFRRAVAASALSEETSLVGLAQGGVILCLAEDQGNVRRR